MNWRALTDPIVWLLFHREPDVCASMRRLFNSTSTLRVVESRPDAKRFVLLRDAKGRWLGPLWRKVRRAA
jgi:hypothetical protein